MFTDGARPVAGNRRGVPNLAAPPDLKWPPAWCSQGCRFSAASSISLSLDQIHKVVKVAATGTSSYMYVKIT